jgi:hypothetical protein
MKRKEQFIQTRRLERITVTRTGGRPHPGPLCELCGRNVDWLTLDGVSAMTGIGTEQVRHKAVNGEYHVRFTPHEPILICSRSVAEEEGF